jgi:hypothetical protein
MQGAYLARQSLLSLGYDIPVNIWYDWKEDGQNPQEKEHHFGVVTPTYQPKPAYRAMQRLTQELQGYVAQKWLPTPPGDYVLVFRRSNQVKLAAWTENLPHALPLPQQGLSLNLSWEPQYVRLVNVPPLFPSPPTTNLGLSRTPTPNPPLARPSTHPARPPEALGNPGGHRLAARTLAGTMAVPPPAAG